MANSRFITFPVGLLLLLCTTAAHGQRFQPFGPLDFTHDLQPFAPAEISSYGGGPDPNTGFFFSYDSLHLYVNRPATALVPNKLDRSQGNRINFGYMSESNNGWLGEWMRINGPNVHDAPSDQQRDYVTLNPSGIDPNTGLPIMTKPSATTETVPPGFAENVASLSSFELSKVWRLKPLHRGSHLELFFGGRYTTITAEDSYDYDRLYTRDLSTAGAIGSGGLVPGVPYPAIGGPPNMGPDIQLPGYTPLGILAENKIFGPQVGMRWFKKKGRWSISAEGRGFAAINHQYITGGYPIASPNPSNVSADYGNTIGYNYVGTKSTSVGGGTATTDGPILQQLVPPEPRTVVTYERRQWLWAPAGDLRLEASWDITKSFALEAGFEMLYFANGIARGKGVTPNQTVQDPTAAAGVNKLYPGNFIDFTDQDMIFTGWTVGFVLNR
jgi:hypothetical protein